MKKSGYGILIRKMEKEDLDAILFVTRRAWGRYTLYQLLEEKHGHIWKKSAQERKVSDIKNFCEMRLVVAKK